MKRVGILTSGGDCQGLNATIRAVAKTLYNQLGNDVEIIGIIDGYRGLIYNETRMMKPDDFSGILTRGGTILGTSRQPMMFIVVDLPEPDGPMMATNSWASIFRSTPFKARISASPRP